MDQKTASNSRKIKIPKQINNTYMLRKKISSGSFGIVFQGVDKNTNIPVAIKLEKDTPDEFPSIEREVQILQKVQGVQGVPKLYFSGQENSCNVMVIQLLGQDFAHILKQQKKLSLKTIVMLADQMLQILEGIHNRSVIHRDLKPENILIGMDKESNKFYLVDYGISKVFRDAKGNHSQFKDKRPFIGTTRYASISAHKGLELGRKDDLESLGYVLVFLYKGNLPWQKIKNKNHDVEKNKIVGDMKSQIDSTELCKDLPLEFTRYFDFVKKMHFQSQPDYKYLASLFQRIAIQHGYDYDGQMEWVDSSTDGKGQQTNPMKVRELSKLSSHSNQLNLRSESRSLLKNKSIDSRLGSNITMNQSQQNSSLYNNFAPSNFNNFQDSSNFSPAIQNRKRNTSKAGKLMGSNPSGVKIKLKDKWDLDKLSDEEPILDNLVKVQDSMRNQSKRKIY